MRGVVIVGAGWGSGLEDFADAETLVAIEGEASTFQQLQRRVVDLPNAHALQAIIADASGPREFHSASRLSESGLIPPGNLQSLWRNLSIRSVERLESVSLDELLPRMSASTEARHAFNWLRIDCLPAATVLEGAVAIVDELEVIELRCVSGDVQMGVPEASLAACTAWLEPRGFRMILLEEELNPLLLQAVFVRDPRPIAERAQLLEEQLEALTFEHEAQSQQATNQLTQLRGDVALAREEIGALNKKAEELQGDKIALEQALQVEKLRGGEVLSQFERLVDMLGKQKGDLEGQIKRQSDELIAVRKFLESTVKKEVGAAARQVEAVLGLQRYLSSGELPDFNLEAHTWPVCPDFSLYLIELLELNDYDVIIEFGSGISTAIIAKTLAQIARRRNQKRSVDFVSFDHLQKYYQQTHDRLQHVGLIDSVRLTLAPLQPWKGAGGETQDYYACEETIAALAHAHREKKLKVLVVVDGPPAATGKHARYPAGPIILQHFAGAQIDLLLDDYIRDDEKEIAKRWQAEIAAAGYTQTMIERKLEKDACLIRISSSTGNNSQ
jgi:hypothetical protein